MNINTANKITSSALFLMTSDALKYRQYLEPCLRMALDILNVLRKFASEYHTSYQISQYLEKTTQIYREKGLNVNTVCQILRALKKGGVSLSSHRKKGWIFQSPEK